MLVVWFLFERKFLDVVSKKLDILLNLSIDLVHKCIFGRFAHCFDICHLSHIYQTEIILKFCHHFDWFVCEIVFVNFYTREAKIIQYIKKHIAKWCQVVSSWSLLEIQLMLWSKENVSFEFVIFCRFLIDVVSITVYKFGCVTEVYKNSVEISTLIFLHHNVWKFQIIMNSFCWMNNFELIYHLNDDLEYIW